MDDFREQLRKMAQTLPDIDGFFNSPPEEWYDRGRRNAQILLAIDPSLTRDRLRKISEALIVSMMEDTGKKIPEENQKALVRGALSCIKRAPEKTRWTVRVPGRKKKHRG